MKRKRRTSKEPEVAPESPFAPVIALGRAQIRALSATIADDDTGEIAAGLRGRIEGMETILVLCQRAGAGEKLDAPQLVQVQRARDEGLDDGKRASRLADLERRVALLEGVERPKPRPVPPILETPQESPASSPRAKAQGLDYVSIKYERDLLRVLAARRGAGTSAEQLAVLAGRSIRSSAFDGALRTLRGLALIEGTSKDLRITEAGDREIGPVDPMPTGAALVGLWMARLEKNEAKMLEVLVAHFDDALSRAELARESGYSATSSSFDTAMRKLRSLKLASEGWPARASGIFFGREA